MENALQAKDFTKQLAIGRTHCRHKRCNGCFQEPQSVESGVHDVEKVHSAVEDACLNPFSLHTHRAVL
jgi:hypothetical protein